MTHQWVLPLESGSADKGPLLGGKGAGLAQMWHLGVPTLPGFVVTTESWKTHTPGSRSLIPDLWREVRDAVANLEEQTSNTLGSSTNPLIVSVRSSPVVSMPGQLRTVLNVGVNAEVAESLAEGSEDPSFASEAFIRLIQMYGETVHGIPRELFSASAKGEERAGLAEGGQALTGAHQAAPAVDGLLAVFQQETREDFPQDPYVQLERSIAAVFDSWSWEGARRYRASHRIPDDEGTAVIVQQMAFGNRGPDSGSGVVFTRNPATGEREIFGEYLPGSQGEQLVGGQVTPGSISHLAQELPANYAELEAICSQLEGFYRDVQDVEFTIERGKLWILQTRRAKRSPIATVKAAVDMAEEGLISREEAVRRVNPEVAAKSFGSTFVDAQAGELLAQGIQSSPGAATGKVAFDRVQVEATVATNLPVILVTEQTSADDAAMMPLVSGILTQHGGATSHAAVVARGLGTPCVVGCGGMEIDSARGVVRFGDVTVAQGDHLSIDGATGRVFRGALELVSGGLPRSGELNKLLGWADDMARLRVLANASTPAEIEAALEAGAEGVGLCRTERLYHDFPFLTQFRQVILGDTPAARERALAELRALHREEFRALLGSAQGRRLTVRLLDAPLYHFLPDRDALLTELAELRLESRSSEEIGRREELLQAVDWWGQSTPDFGLRGARLVFAVSEIVEVQVEALLQAACDATADGLPTALGILIPFVSHGGEVKRIRQLVQDVAQRVTEGAGTKISFLIGASIDTPRAALSAGELASLVDFLCINTDALTDAVFCLSGEKARMLLPAYAVQSVMRDGMFVTLDLEGVGSLVQMAVEGARKVRADVEIGIYGSHCQDAAAMSLFDEGNVDFVACHLSYLLGARLMAGQAAVGGSPYDWELRM